MLASKLSFDLHFMKICLIENPSGISEGLIKILILLQRCWYICGLSLASVETVNMEYGCLFLYHD